MSLYAIGDFHLSLGGSKPMDIFGDRWAKHEDKIIAGFSTLTEEDVCVICGDLSWGMGLQACLEDFLFIDRLPGKKIILKGNHDYWWTSVSKTSRFFAENGIETISILHNNYIPYENMAICGTRGWFFEEETGGAHDRKIMLREIGRLKASLEAAGDKNKLVFLHYPPIYADYRCEEILGLLKEHEVRLCCYGHIHGKSCAASFNGWSGGTEFKLVSGDFVNFQPVKLLYNSEISVNSD